MQSRDEIIWPCFYLIICLKTEACCLGWGVETLVVALTLTSLSSILLRTLTHTTSASPSSFLSFFSSAASPSNISPLLESRLLFLAKRHCFGGGSCSMPNTFEMGNFVNEAKCGLIDYWSWWLREEKWKQCSSKLACCAQLLPHILPHFPECIAQSIFAYLNLAQLKWWCRLYFQKCPVLSPSKIPFFWVKLAFPQVLYSHLVNLSECDQPQSMLRRTRNVLSLLAGQTLGSIHRLFLARVQEPGRVWQENSSREGFEHPAQRITWAKWHSCRVEHLEWHIMNSI